MQFLCSVIENIALCGDEATVNELLAYLDETSRRGTQGDPDWCAGLVIVCFARLKQIADERDEWLRSG